MFSANKNRYATFGVLTRTSGPIVDAIWAIIDQNLQGVFPLQNLLKFSLKNKDGQLQVVFSEKDLDGGLAVDLNFDYSTDFPDAVFAYDDGNVQTVLLESEMD
ncbi:DUF960 domain-containing protein [Lacticaseibacillus sharpeae]|nr:DUF960 domain-containing protein [Lacticaseibacillus sharpeae]